MSRFEVRGWVAFCCSFAVCALAADGTRRAEPPSSPLPSTLDEHVNVHLIQAKILVTDREGRPIRDLRPEEVTVLEGKKRQRLAYFESWSGGNRDPALALSAARPGELYTRTGQAVRAEDRVIPTPKPTRRVVLAFDVRNSKLRVREEWRSAAETWVRQSMRGDDQVAVVLLQNYPLWVQLFSQDRPTVLHALQTLNLTGAFSNRDRREDMTQLVGDLRSYCTDLGGGGRRGRRGREGGSAQSGLQTTPSDETSCAYNVAKPFIEQWGTESEESVQNLRQLTGQLAAAPGRKAVLLFSEGIVPDPAGSATNAMLSIWGATVINFRHLGSVLRRDIHGELTALHRLAEASDVVFFTLDTRTNAERGFQGDIEEQVSMTVGALGTNPWSEIFESSRGTLSALAHATGGRPFFGRAELTEHVTRAAESFYGIYALGYYRETALPAGKFKVQIARSRVEIDHDDRPGQRRVEPREVRVDVSIGRPTPEGDGQRLRLPIAVTVPVESLPLRRQGGGHGCQLGVFVQALRLDGSVAAEHFDVTLVAVDERADARGRTHEYLGSLAMEPGPKRLRVRVSDDANQTLGDTYIDLTLADGSVEPGFRETPMPVNEAPSPR